MTITPPKGNIIVILIYSIQSAQYNPLNTIHSIQSTQYNPLNTIRSIQSTEFDLPIQNQILNFLSFLAQTLIFLQTFLLEALNLFSQT